MFYKIQKNQTHLDALTHFNNNPKHCNSRIRGKIFVAILPKNGVKIRGTCRISGRLGRALRALPFGALQSRGFRIKEFPANAIAFRFVGNFPQSRTRVIEKTRSVFPSRPLTREIFSHTGFNIRMRQ